MMGDLYKKKRKKKKIYECFNKGNGGFQCQARIASQEKVILLEILKKERKTKILSIRCCCSHKSDTLTPDQRAYYCSVFLWLRSRRDQKEVRWALDLSARVFWALMHCWKYQSSECRWRDYKHYLYQTFCATVGVHGMSVQTKCFFYCR